MSKIPTVAKALVAALTTFGGLFTTAYLDKAVTNGEWVTVVVGTLVAGLGVWAVPNKEAQEVA